MIKWRDAIREARLLIGTPYAQLDCINLIKKVIRDAPGGVKSYTTAGSNALWRSYDSTPKYKDLTWRREGIFGAKAGDLAFKARGEDYHHVGLVTDVGTVLHSSSTQGGRGVVETPLTAKGGWTHIATHRYITNDGNIEEDKPMYNAKVKLDDHDSSLNLRNGPSTSDMVIGSLVHGDTVEVLAEADNWLYVRHNSASGYVSANYLVRVEDTADDFEVTQEVSGRFTTIMRTDGVIIRLDGDWRVAED